MALLTGPSPSLAMLLLALLTPALRGQPAAEYEVKAAFLFNFTRFVNWPDPVGSGPFCIGIVGADPFEGAIEQATNGRSVGGRPIVIKHFKPGEDPQGCEMVFVSGTDKKKVASILASLKGTGILTVGETPGFCAMGGAIAFAVQDSKVKLEVNPDAAARAHLQISSKLLSLATLVRDVHP